MTKQATLHIDIRSYWHTGTGRGSGSHLDALVDTAHDGLPYLSGRHLKGLLRDAVYKAEQWGQLDAFKPEAAHTVTDLLFGKRNAADTRVPRDETTAGLLRIGDGVLPEAIRSWLAHRDQAALRPHLQRELTSTAVDSDTGTAKSRSLRGIQVSIPLHLEASITAQAPLQRGDEAPIPDLSPLWRDILEHCLPLIRAVGAQRTRGLGRASLSLQGGRPQ